MTEVCGSNALNQKRPWLRIAHRRLNIISNSGSPRNPTLPELCAMPAVMAAVERDRPSLKVSVHVDGESDDASWVRYLTALPVLAELRIYLTTNIDCQAARWPEDVGDTQKARAVELVLSGAITRSSAEFLRRLGLLSDPTIERVRLECLGTHMCRWSLPSLTALYILYKRGAQGWDQGVADTLSQLIRGTRQRLACVVLEGVRAGPSESIELEPGQLDGCAYLRVQAVYLACHDARVGHLDVGRLGGVTGVKANTVSLGLWINDPGRRLNDRYAAMGPIRRVNARRFVLLGTPEDYSFQLLGGHTLDPTVQTLLSTGGPVNRLQARRAFATHPSLQLILATEAYLPPAMRPLPWQLYLRRCPARTLRDTAKLLVGLQDGAEPTLAIPSRVDVLSFISALQAAGGSLPGEATWWIVISLAQLYCVGCNWIQV